MEAREGSGSPFNPALPDTPPDVHFQVLRGTRGRDSSCSGKVCVCQPGIPDWESSGIAAGLDQLRGGFSENKGSWGKHMRTIPDCWNSFMANPGWL